jgi:hypothetical protein
VGTGILYSIIVLAWLAYLVPLIRSHRRESAPVRSVDAFANTMRVLGKRSAASARGGSAVRVSGPAPRTAARDGEVVRAGTSTSAEQRASRKRAASRRRIVLSLLLAATTAVTALAFVGLLAWWAVAIPVSATLGFLGLSMLTTARHKRRSSQRLGRAPVTVGAARSTPSGARRVDAVYPGLVARPAVGRQAVAATDRSALDEAAAWVANSQLGAWEPRPVALPAYVTAPRAAVRTVRTIDLADATVFSAGHLPEAVLLGRQPDSVDELAEAAGAGREDDDGDARVAAGA